MEQFSCPYLGKDVELTDEREEHIENRHPTLIQDYLERLAQTIAEPDKIHRSQQNSNTRLFCRFYDDFQRRKYVIVIVRSDLEPVERSWIVTAYRARNLPKGKVLWTRS
ncbi:MAG: PBECR2 nuclease fold domain-containing protein [Cyanophyceae cyanobacterium]